MNNPKYSLHLTLWMLCLAFALPGSAQTSLPADTASRKATHLLSVEFKPAYVFPTDAFFRGDNRKQNPLRANLSGHVKYGFQFAPDSYWGKHYPHVVQGIGVGYNTFFNPTELGNPVSVYAFQTARIATLAPRLYLNYEWDFGASFGWKKFDEEDNYYNTVVGSKINAYINLGFSLYWAINPNTSLKAGIDLTHYSNGNTNYPNFGVNTLGGSIGLVRRFGADRRTEPDAPSSFTAPGQPAFRPYVSYDLVLYGATRRKGSFPPEGDPLLVPGSFGIVGLNFAPMYNFSRYFRAGLSLDAQYDESANIDRHIANSTQWPTSDNIRFYRPPFIEQFSVGLSARAEIVMPIFSINLGIGRNILCKGPDTNSFYQVLALKADITRFLFLHVGYQLYRFKDPNNLMLGLGFRFHGRR